MQLGLAMETDKERKERLKKMVATVQLMLALIKGVIDVGVVLSLKPILKSWQLFLSFKLASKASPTLGCTIEISRDIYIRVFLSYVKLAA